MSKPQGNSIVGSTPHASTHDPIPTRRVSDKFSSSHSYAPEYHAQTTYITQRRLCEQLRQDAKRERMKVSIVCKDLVRYIIDHQSDDALIVGFPSSKDNPFRDKQQCLLL